MYINANINKCIDNTFYIFKKPFEVQTNTVRPYISTAIFFENYTNVFVGLYPQPSIAVNNEW